MQRDDIVPSRLWDAAILEARDPPPPETGVKIKT